MATTIVSYTKSPAANLDYTIDFSAWLQPDEQIVAAAWSRAPVGITIGAGAYAPTISADGKKCTVWLSAGTAGTSYTVTVNITTDNTPPRIDDKSILIVVGDE